MTERHDMTRRRALMTGAGLFDDYQGTAFITTRRWAADNEDMPEDRARGAVAGLRDNLSADFNMAGINTVLDLRSRYGAPRKTLDDPSKYLGTRYLEAAHEAP